MSTSATQWAEVVRLRTLPAAVAPVLLGAAASGVIGGVRADVTLLAVLVALALQIGSNLANDYSDGIRGTDDDRSGPPRLTASGAVPAVYVKYAAFGCFALAGVAGLGILALTGYWWLVGAGVAAVAAAWFYTGGPRPYGYAGLGEIFVFVFFGLMATCGTTYVQSGTVPGWLWLAASGIGVLACSLLMVNNLRDIDTDPLHGKRTLAVRLGDTWARRAFVGSVVAPIPMGIGALWWAAAGRSEMNGAVLSFMSVLLLLVTALPARAAIRPVLQGATGFHLIPCLKYAGLTELAYAAVLSLALLIAV